MGEALLGQGVRLPWTALPPAVHDGVAAIAGAPVVSARTCAGGFSPGAAAALTLEGGGRAFVKAVSTTQNPDAPAIYRDEAAVNAWLPPHPAVPALLGTYDDGEWVALVFEHVDAPTPTLPWVEDELDVVLRTAVAYQTAAGPVDHVASPVTSLYERHFASWAALAAEPPDGLDPWSRAHAADLAMVEAGWAEAAAGSALLHTDLRADNVLVRGDRAWIVDWPWACAGAAWVDGLLMAPTVASQGGPPADAVMARMYPDAPRDGVLALVAGLSGYFTLTALLPPPPGLPTLRAHQARQGVATREWLARLLAC